MLSALLFLLTTLLVLVSLFLIFIVLAQKAKSDGGVGAAMGGGMAEAAFGAETNTVLSKMTIGATILFFTLSLALYLGRLYQDHHPADGLPTLSAPAALPALPAPGAAAPGAVAVPPVEAVPAPGTAAPAAAPAAATPAPAAPAPGAAK